MAGKKGKSDIEGIRTELQNLSEAVWALREHVSVRDAIAAASASTRDSTDSTRAAIRVATGVATDLAARVGAGAKQGFVVSRGVFQDARGAREYRWESEEAATTLLSIDDGQVAHVLAAIGHRQRLAILKTILDQPRSAAELVTILNLGTTGAAYHHLNVLQAADLVTQEERGVYIVQPHRVSAILAILAGVASAKDTTYSEPPAMVDDEVTTYSELPAMVDCEDASSADGRGRRKKRKAS